MSTNQITTATVEAAIALEDEIRAHGMITHLHSAAEQGWMLIVLGSAVVTGVYNATWIVKQLHTTICNSLGPKFRILVRSDLSADPDATEPCFEFGIAWGNVTTEIRCVSEEPQQDWYVAEDESESPGSPPLTDEDEDGDDNDHFETAANQALQTFYSIQSLEGATISNKLYNELVAKSNKIVDDYKPDEYDAMILETTRTCLERSVTVTTTELLRSTGIYMQRVTLWPHDEAMTVRGQWLINQLQDLLDARNVQIVMLYTTDLPYIAVTPRSLCIVQVDV